MRYLWLLLTILFTGMIFYNSSLDGSVSSSASRTAVELLQPLWAALGLSVPDVSEFFLRKMAHFLSFAFLCWLWSCSFSAFRVGNGTATGYIFFFCLLTAVLDEYIQLFSAGRDSGLADVLLDFSGAFCMWLWLRLWLWKK